MSEAGEGWSDSRIVDALDTSLATVARTRQRLVDEGFDAVLTRKQAFSGQFRACDRHGLDGKIRMIL